MEFPVDYPVPEGATPIFDISDLKLEGIVTYSQLCEAEAESIFKAANKFLSSKRSIREPFFTESNLLKIHREMFNEVWAWAGKYRKSITNIGVKPYLIKSEIIKLCHDVQFWVQETSPISLIEQVARIHHRLVSIHPFENGNGRHARLVADIYLQRQGGIHPRWPIDLAKTSAARKLYIQALQVADQGNYDLLMEYMCRYGARY